MPIVVDIDVMLAKRKMSVGTLAERVGITPANLAVLKNGRAKAVRFTTLDALCEALGCQPGDVLRWEPEEGPDGLPDDPRQPSPPRPVPGPPPRSSRPSSPAPGT
jgi:putative transcriptional regulator